MFKLVAALLLFSCTMIGNLEPSSIKKQCGEEIYTKTITCEDFQGHKKTVSVKCQRCKDANGKVCRDECTPSILACEGKQSTFRPCNIN